MKLLLIILVLMLVLYACTSNPKLIDNRTANSHIDKLSNIPETKEVDVKSAFGKIFTDLKAGATEDNIRSVYAEQLYFNDTFRIIDNVDDLVDYLVKTANHVNSTTVEIMDVVKGENDYFVKWSMRMNFKVKGKEVDSYSLGMTQLRFNDDGLIVFHQDFWDSSEAFFEHLPVVGRIIKTIKSKL
jgi:hypothetical protein